MRKFGLLMILISLSVSIYPFFILDPYPLEEGILEISLGSDDTTIRYGLLGFIEAGLGTSTKGAYVKFGVPKNTNFPIKISIGISTLFSSYSIFGSVGYISEYIKVSGSAILTTNDYGPSYQLYSVYLNYSLDRNKYLNFYVGYEFEEIPESTPIIPVSFMFRQNFEKIEFLGIKNIILTAGMGFGNVLIFTESKNLAEDIIKNFYALMGIKVSWKLL